MTGADRPVATIRTIQQVVLTHYDGEKREFPISSNWAIYPDRLSYGAMDLATGSYFQIADLFARHGFTVQRLDDILSTYQTTLDEITTHAGISSEEFLMEMRDSHSAPGQSPPSR